jgi:hypothetical protein
MGFVSSRRMSLGDRCTGLPDRHHPLSEFLTPSAVCSRPGLAALFRATSAHRISASRAFPSQPAVTPSDARCSRAVGPASRPSTSEPCSDWESVPGRPRLSERSSRCSHDLFPLRGFPAQPLGLRPPLMRLLVHVSRRPKTRCPVESRRFRVSIRLGLGATPKSGANPREVCNLPIPGNPPTTAGEPSIAVQIPHTQARASSAVCRAVTRCESRPPTEVRFLPTRGVT